MTDNKVNLARDFIKYCEKALIAESDYFSKNNQAITLKRKQHYDETLKKNGRVTLWKWNKRWKYEANIDSFEDYVWDVHNLFPHADQYQEYCEKLNSSSHAFQDSLLDSTNYCETLSTLRSKEVFVYICTIYEKKDLPTLNIEVFLDKMLAESIVRWNDINEYGIERYLPDKRYVNAITASANKLLKTINDSPEYIKQSISRSFMRNIAGMANGIGSSKRPIQEAHIKLSDFRYIPTKNHNYADREFLIRELALKYMHTFGYYMIKKITPEIETSPINVIRRFADYESNEMNDPEKYVLRRDNMIIHTDVISSLLSVIDISFSSINQRQISLYAQRQKKRENKYRWFTYNGLCHMNEDT